MDEAHDQRARELVDPHPAEPAVEPGERRLIGACGMRVGLMMVLMAVDVVPVAMRMRVRAPSSPLASATVFVSRARARL